MNRSSCKSLLVTLAPTCLAEKSYALNILFKQHLGIPIQIVESEAEHHEIQLPNGKVLILEDAFFKNEKWLDKENLPTKPVYLEKNDKNQAELVGMYGSGKFQTLEKGLFIGLDILASAFFLLTRWEEYIKTDRDQHGRFPADASFLVEHNLHKKIWVERYAAALCVWLNALGFTHKMPERSAVLQISCDVDHPLLWPGASFWQRGLLRWSKLLVGSLIKRRDVAEFRYFARWKGEKDPYDTTDYLMDLAEKNELPPIQFNFLAAKKGDKDAFYSLNRPDVQDVFKKIKKRGHVIGFHPSRSAATDFQTLESEFERLKQAFLDTSITSGRQHYLKFEMPKTFKMLDKIGIQSDSSIGFSTMTGFRCGTARPFPMFDFLEKKQLNIIQQPLVFMDVAPFKTQKQSPQAIENDLNDLKNEVKAYQSDFTLLWHNSCVYGSVFENYRGVFEHFIHNYHKTH